MPDLMWWLAVVFAIAGAIGVVAALNALLERRLGRTVMRLSFALLFLALGALIVAVGLGVQGYRTLTHEELAATVRIEPVGAKRFRAQLRFPDGREQVHLLDGDEFYIDARVLKWHPWANVLGLHTAYELDRVAGRYLDIVEERSRPRTVFTLAPEERPVDLFSLRRRYVLLSPVLDADYGSATFSPADAPALYEVRVSTSGLLVRRLDTPAR